MSSNGRIVIVGAGEAGIAAASAIREDGYEGEVVIVNDEPVPPYERPPLSKEMLYEGEAAVRPIQPQEWYEDNRIQLLSDTRVTGIDASADTVTLESKGEVASLSYDKLMFATGARARRLPQPTEGLYYLRTFNDCLSLHGKIESLDKIAIVGGGIIGLEVASFLSAQGKQVTVLDMADRLMSRAVTPEVSDFLLDLHQRNGVEFRLGEKVNCTEKGVELGDGSFLEADLVLVAIGVSPNSELAEAAGCATDDGIVVDECGRTTVEGLFAAGDVARFPHPSYARPMRVESWQHAGRHGAHVGRAMLGIDDGYREVPWFWTDQYDVNLQVVGLSETADLTLWRDSPNGRTALHFADGQLVAATTINNGRDIRPLTSENGGAKLDHGSAVVLAVRAA
ncbi:NAD(P)/FAD-dependent oxidoreductase [Henriciella aquimarina]|uniref:NAD(P)/FAD-dependent oxidoreductase n=1 Tax=Henriciella aquimarina TaxID=545261 RepID=UPI001301B9A4|nr:FAD-dependent oxidoreductase [Henriciella aquimarina]